MTIAEPTLAGGRSRSTESAPPNPFCQSLGPYELCELLGQGGCGQVYRATHRWLEKPVAIKFLSLPESDSPASRESIERFRREAVTAARLDHPAFVSATDGGQQAGFAFLVSELVDGENLHQLVERHGPLPLNVACEIIRQTAEALAFLTRQGGVHRDIKPSNLMIDRQGQVRILDLGLARLASDHTLTQTGVVMGTVDYLAPEQARDPRAATHHADIYSLGCTFYYLLTGHAPFASDQSDTLAARLIAQAEGTYRPVTDFGRQVPSQVVGLIDRMLAKEPQDRPRDHHAITQQLSRHTNDVDLRSLYGELPAEDTGPDYDWIDELIVRWSRAIGRAFLVVCGVLEPVESSRQQNGRTYQYSYRWLRYVGVVLLFVVGIPFVMNLLGIGMEVPGIGIIGAPPPPGYELQY